MVAPTPGPRATRRRAPATAAREGYRIPRIQKVLAMPETTEEEKRDAKQAKWKRAVAHKAAKRKADGLVERASWMP